MRQRVVQLVLLNQGYLLLSALANRPCMVSLQELGKQHQCPLTIHTQVQSILQTLESICLPACTCGLHVPVAYCTGIARLVCQWRSSTGSYCYSLHIAICCWERGVVAGDQVVVLDLENAVPGSFSCLQYTGIPLKIDCLKWNRLSPYSPKCPINLSCYKRQTHKRVPLETKQNKLLSLRVVPQVGIIAWCFH